MSATAFVKCKVVECDGHDIVEQGSSVGRCTECGSAILISDAEWEAYFDRVEQSGIVDL